VDGEDSADDEEYGGTAAQPACSIPPWGGGGIVAPVLVAAHGSYSLLNHPYW